MFATLALFEDIILTVEILLQERRAALSKTKLKIIFNDGSILFLREIIIENVLLDYSYHWQHADNSLIVRWDNAAHFPDIMIFPHHKHIASENIVEQSNEQSLYEVLVFIRNKLAG
jgi:hypothetical protein